MNFLCTFRRLALVLLLSAATARAATVTWSTSTVSGPSDVLTTGTLVGAMNVGASLDAPVVNGVTFAVDPGGAGALALGSATVTFSNLANSFDAFWDLPNPGGSFPYGLALDAGRWGASGSGTVTLGGLTVGRTYLVQLWIVDTRAGTNSRVRTVDGVATTSGGPNIATGRFIADAATQVITVDDGAGTFGPQVNLLHLRDVTITVTNNANTGAGSLRQALADAAAAAGVNSIVFAPALSGQTITLASEIVVGDSGGVTVDASALAGGLTLHGGPGENRLFSVTSGGNVTLRGLNLTGGDGGGVNSPGGAILNAGTLALHRCTLHGNTTNDSTGGAIHSTGTLILTQSTVSGNTGGTLGGGLYASGTVSLTHVTFGGNTAFDGGSAIFLASGSLTLAHSAISGTILSNGTLTRVGASIVQANPGGTLNGAGTLIVADPLLGPLGDYGGPTLTMRPRFASPVENAATTSTITTDQRGLALIGGGPDAGACEANAALPTIGDITDRTIAEDAATTALAFTIGDSETAVSALTVSGGSSNTTLVPSGNISFGGIGANRTVTVTPAPNQNGAATITVTVNDGLDIAQDTFLLTVTAVNDAPTLDAIGNRTISEDAGPQTVSLGGISAGPVESSQTLTVTATSSNTALIPHPTIAYTSPQATGTLTYTSAANASGTADITVTVTDGQASNNAVIRTFTVTVTATNDAPVASAQSLSTNEDNALSITLAGTDVESSALTFSIISLPAKGTIAGTVPNLTYTPFADEHGADSFTFKVNDGASDSASATISITVIPVADNPGVPNATTDEDTQTAALVVTRNPVDGSEVSHFRITAITNGTLFQNNGITPINANSFITFAQANAGLRFTPGLNFNGTGSFTVQGSTSSGVGGLGGTPAISTIIVNPVNDAPTLADIPHRVLAPSAGPQMVNLAGIGTGAADETQTLSITATSNNTAFIPHPSVTYTSPDATGSLRFTPAEGQTGVALVTVTVSDGTATTIRTFYVSVPVRLASNVTHPGDSGPGSLRQAVSTALAAWGSRSISFDPVLSGQTIILGSHIPLEDYNNTGSETLTIDATSLPGGLTIDGGPGTNRIFILPSGDHAMLRGLTLTGGNSDTLHYYQGGAIYNAGTLTLEQCILSGNTGSTNHGLGGAISSYTGSLTLTECTLSGNWSGNAGGAIYCDYSPLTLTRCTFSGNSSRSGGAVTYGNAPATLTQCTFSGNTAAYNGGAIASAFQSVSTLTQCTISGNTSHRDGGAFFSNGPTTLVNSLIAGNTAPAAPDILIANGSPLSRGGVNLIGNISGTSSGPVADPFPVGTPNINGDYVGTATAPLDPLFGPLANNGGPRSTRALQAGSPAINRIGNEAQKVTVSGTGGFQLTFKGASTPNLAFTTTAAQLQAALNSLPTINAEGGSVEVVSFGNEFRVTFDGGTLRGVNQPLMTSTANAGTATVTPLADGGLPFPSDQRGFPIVGLADIGAYENGAPTITALADRVALSGIPTAPIAFTLGDAETAATAITVTASSSSTNLVPNANVMFSGTSTNRTVAVTPVAGQAGTATITLTVNDGANTTSTNLLLTVLANTPYNTWKLAEFGNSAATPAIAGDTADGDLDRLNTFVEYATRGNPHALTALPLGHPIPVSGPAWQMSFPYRHGDPQLRYIVQRNADLSNPTGWGEIYRYDFTAGAQHALGVTSTLDTLAQRITLSDSAAGTTTYWRLLVEEVVPVGP